MSEIRKLAVILVADVVGYSRHCHINRFYWSVLTPWPEHGPIK